MNILHVGKYFAPFRGGLENYMRDLMVALSRQGTPGTALVHRHDRSFGTREESLDISGETLRVVRVGTWLRLFFTPISPAFPWQLRRLLRAESPDVLHLHLPNPSAFWALALPSARRVPWVVHWHADVITAAQGWMMRVLYAVYRPFEYWILKRAAAIVATSEPYLQSSLPLRPWLAKCRVVPLGLDPSRLRPEVHAEPGTADQPPRRHGSPPLLQVLAVGRLTYYKGFQYLIEAVSQAHNLQLDLVGDGEEFGRLRQLADSLGVGDRVTFHGSLDDLDLARMMARCDCLCLPSIERTEAFGMVLLEAMSLGKATVISDVPGSGMSWIVEHGVTGLKTKPANSIALAGALMRLDRDREALIRMGLNGKQRFDQMYEINHTSLGILDTYRAVCQSDGGKGG